ncbi:MAG: hypothetical protein AAGA48_24175 [Myxococcota bacterium]
MLLALTWLACAGSPVEGCDAEPLGVTLGTGVTAFEPLAANDEVIMVFGPQGGWHIDVAARVTGAGPDVEVLPMAERLSDGLALAGDQVSSLVALVDYDAENCAGDVVGIRAFLDDADPGPDVPYADFICSLDGAEVELSVDVSDFGTRTGTSKLVVTTRTDVGQDCP